VTVKKIAMLLAMAVLQAALSVPQAVAQSANSCQVHFQYCAGETWPVPPGTQCQNTYGVPYVCIDCWVGSNKCQAICQECQQNTPTGGGPVNLANGDTFITQTDLSIPGLGGGLTLSRTWHSQFPFGESVSTAGMFGGDWTSTYEESIFIDYVDQLVKYLRGTGGIWTFGISGLGTPDYYAVIAPANGNVTLSYDGTFYTLAFLTGEKRIFSVATGQLLSMIDRNGNTTQMTYDTSNRLITVTDPASRHLYFTYASASSNLVTGVSSDAGISLSYAYDNMGRLTTVTKPDLTTVSFQYDSNSMITAVLDSQGKVLESHTYDSLRRGLTSTRANGVDSMTITYPPIETGWLPF